MYYGLSLEWDGDGENEKGTLAKNQKIDTTALLDNEKLLVEKFHYARKGETIVIVNPRYFRPTEVDILIGDYSKAKSHLGWEPKIKFEKLVQIMVKADFEKIKDRSN